MGMAKYFEDNLEITEERLSNCNYYYEEYNCYSFTSYPCSSNANASTNFNYNKATENNVTT